MIAKVYIFDNGMVAAFDEAGHQMGHYQGPLDDVRERILRDMSPDRTVFVCRWWGLVAPFLLRGGVMEKTDGLDNGTMPGTPDEWPE